MDDVNQVVQPVEPVIEPTVEPTQTTEPVQDPTQTEPQVDNSLELDGIGKVTVDEIKEWKQGHLRQSDYTRKTQELAQQRKQYEDALQIYEYLKANPHKAKMLAEDDDDDTPMVQKPQMPDPVLSRVAQLEQQLIVQQLDREIVDLKSKYPDFDEVKVLTEADKRGIADLEFVYKAMRDSDMSNNVDVNKLKAEIRQEILQQLKSNTTNTATIIDNQSTPPSKPVTLSAQEMKVAEGLGLTPEDYLKWK